MVVDRTDKVTVRIGRLELTKLGWALVLSLVAHLLFWGAYAANQKFHLLALLRLPAWMERVIIPPPPVAQPPPLNREPMMFLDVREDQSVPEPPKDAKRYSDKNSFAANPEPDKNPNMPKVDGEKNELQKLDDSGRRNKFDQLMPDPPKEEAKPEVKPATKPGTMTVAKADLRPPQERQRPRTIREAMLQKNQSPGQRTKQEGGVPRKGQIAMDVKVTGFGAYDRMFIDAVANRWYDLLDQLSYDNYRQGKVVVQFTLNYKGEISNVEIVQNTVTDTLSLMCQKAIRDPAPFGEWTREMRLAVGEDSRRITFTFYYN